MGHQLFPQASYHWIALKPGIKCEYVFRFFNFKKFVSVAVMLIARTVTLHQGFQAPTCIHTPKTFVGDDIYRLWLLCILPIKLIFLTFISVVVFLVADGQRSHSCFLKNCIAFINMPLPNRFSHFCLNKHVWVCFAPANNTQWIPANTSLYTYTIISIGLLQFIYIHTHTHIYIYTHTHMHTYISLYSYCLDFDILIHHFPKGSKSFHPYWKSMKTHFFASSSAMNSTVLWLLWGGRQNCGDVTPFLFTYDCKLIEIA